MHSFKASALLASTILLSLSHAQYSIDPNSVPPSQRDVWCQTQKTSCPLLCLQLPGESSTTEANTCDAAALTYQCVCGNGQSPNASEYSQTLPYYICTEYNTQCVTACKGDSSCQSACQSDHPCGAQNPTRVNSTSTMSATATGSGTNSAGQVFNGLGGGSTSTSSPSTKNSAQAALDLGRSYGLAVVFAGVFAGFTLIL